MAQSEAEATKTRCKSQMQKAFSRRLCFLCECVSFSFACPKLELEPKLANANFHSSGAIDSRESLKHFGASRRISTRHTAHSQTPFASVIMTFSFGVRAGASFSQPAALWISSTMDPTFLLEAPFMIASTSNLNKFNVQIGAGIEGQRSM